MFQQWPQFLCTRQGWKQTSFAGRLKSDQCKAMEMVGGSGAPDGERRDGGNQALLAWRRDVSGKP